MSGILIIDILTREPLVPERFGNMKLNCRRGP